MARKKPISPRGDLNKREIRKLADHWEYLESRMGGQKALAEALTNPTTGKPYNSRTLRKWWSGERKIPQSVSRQIDRLYSDIQRAEKLTRRRNKRQAIRDKIWIYDFPEWFMAIENEVAASYDSDVIDQTLENLHQSMTGTNPQTVLIFGDNMPGWLSPISGKHSISEICHSDLILYGFRVFVNDNYTRTYPMEHRPPLPMWNYERRKYTRREDYPKVLDLILEAWENLSSSEFGFPVLVGFIIDPEQIK